MTASGDPAAAMRFEMSAVFGALESSDDLWEWEAEEEIDEIAESMEDVRGITGGSGRSVAPEEVVVVGETGGDRVGGSDVIDVRALRI